MRQMRWASDHLVSGDPRREKLGADQLRVLLASDLLTESEKLFIDSALGSSVAELTAEIERAEAAGQEVTIIQISLEEAEALRALGEVEDVVVDLDDEGTDQETSR